MATPEQKAPTEVPEPKPTGGAKPGKKAKAPKAPKQKRTRGEKSARDYAVEFLMKQPGHKAKFGELIKEVSTKITGGHPDKLTWTPTYYLHSPGFSSPEHGVYHYDPKAEEKARAELKATRSERLAKAREAKGKTALKAKKAKGENKPKTGKNEVEARRIASAEALKAKKAEEAAKAEQAAKEFDEAAKEQANGNKKETA